VTTRTDQVHTPDGAYDLPLWHPTTGHGPGIVLIQEIFGLDDYLTTVAEDLAALGYVVAVPDLFWRQTPHWSSAHDQAGLTASLDLAGRFDPARGETDVIAALTHLRALPEVTGRAGVLGFCLGGSLAYAAAAHSDPDAAVSFYGSAVPDATADLAHVTCPIQFHFGGQDPYITRDAVRKVETAVADHPGAEIHVQEHAGHAFHNHAAPMFHHPDAAAAAWTLTTAFLARALPVT
jgi:carboxymethylenebutenolidase